MERIEQLLQEKNHGVLLTTVTLATEIARTSRKWRPHLRKMIPTLVKILRGLLVNSYALEHDIHGIADPFLQCAILRLLRVLAKGNQKASEAITDILVQVATNTDGGKNAGNSILYECARTILDIPGDQGLRNLATNQLGKFLISKDNNLRFVALQMMTKVIVDLHDHAAVNRHISTIVDCLRDHDIAIKMRALELISALFNHQNVKFLAKELLGYLQVTPDGVFKEQLATKLCTAMEQYAPSNEYQLATLLRVITLAGQYVRDNVSNNFIGLVTQTPQLQQKITKNLFQAVESIIPKPHLLARQQTLVQVTVWCLGEYGDLVVDDQEITEQQILSLMTQLLESSEISILCRHVLITSLAKMSERFPQSSEPIQQLIERYKDSVDVEMQQRSVEFSNLFRWSNSKSTVLDKMPPMPMDLINRISQKLDLGPRDGGDSDVEEEEGHQNGSTSDSINEQGLIRLEDIVQLSDSVSPAGQRELQQQSNLLLDLFDDQTTSTQSLEASRTHPKPAPTQLETLDSLLDLGGSINASNSSSSSAVQVSNNHVDRRALQTSAPSLDDLFADATEMTRSPVGGEKRTMAVFDKDGLVIEFELRKPDPSVATYQLVVYFNNKTATPFVEFDFLAAVPKFVQMQIFKPSSSTIPAISEKKVHQKINLTNTMYGTRPLAMKFKVLYKRKDTGVQVTEQGNVANWPHDF